MADTGNPATTNLQQALGHARSLLQKQPALAEEQALEILKSVPNEPNALFVLGASLRLQSKSKEALKVLQKLTKKTPDFAYAFVELGLVEMSLQHFQPAVMALKKATALDDTISIAWRALGDALSILGQSEEAAIAKQKHLSLTVQHPELVEAGGYLHENKLHKAEELLRSFLIEHPSNVNAIRMMGDIALRLDRFRDAENLFSRCLELAPDFHQARSNYADALIKLRKYKEAMTEVERLLSLEPENPSYLIMKANVFSRINEFEPAISIFEKVLARAPNQDKLHLSHGHALKTVGRQEDAIQAYREGIKRDPTLGEAYWSLANLKTFRFEDAEIEAMRQEVKSERPKASNFFHMCFALGKALEDRGEYDEAFQAYHRGNQVKQRLVKYDADDNHAKTRGLIDFFSKDFFASREGQGCQAQDPIFIVGLPRAGSTLLEQILASHSKVEGTMELPDIISIARRLNGKSLNSDVAKYPKILADLDKDQLRELGEEYLERTQIQRSENTPLFIDKMPNNFSHIGLIHLILPNAKIIDARRHPMDGCFSGFKQLFAMGQNFTYGLENIGRYYRDYVELMDFWDQVLTGRIHRVQYEEMVADTENQVRNLLDYCGLDFEESCLRFYETERSVRTASSEQVRQPIYSGSVGNWRHFEKHLDPLKEALGPVLDRYPI